MAINPIPPLLIATVGLIFMSALLGSALADESFPTLSTTNADCGGGGLDKIACEIGNGFNYVVNFFKLIFGAIAFFINAVTFNVPGAPWYARIPISIILGGSIFVSILGFIRGN